MKKITFALITALLLSLTGCGASSGRAGSGLTTEETEAAPEETAAETETTYKEENLIDDDNCSFTVKDIDEDNTLGYTLDVCLENKTDDSLTFAIACASVNGLMSDPLWAEEIVADSKRNSEITFYDLESRNITAVQEIEFELIVYDTDNYDTDYTEDSICHIYPDGTEKEVTYNRKAEASDVVLFDNDDCTMIVTGFDPEGTWGCTMHTYLVNKTAQPLMFTLESAAVNGYTIDPFWSCQVSAGKSAFSDVSWTPDDLESNGIDTVEEIRLPVNVYNTDDLSTILEDTYTFTPPEE